MVPRVPDPDVTPRPATPADLASGPDWGARLARVRARVNEAAARSGRDPDSVALLPTVKYLDPAATCALALAGARDLAENRFDALVAKQAALAELPNPPVPAPDWHYIGRVQSRQVVELARRVAMVHTITSSRAIARLAIAAEADGVSLPRLLLQVNVDGDPAKDGLRPDAVEPFIEALPASIDIAGLMTMPAFTTDPGASRGAFASLRELRDRLRTTCDGRHSLDALSMGTSQDMEVAIEEGATHVRLGRILFLQEE